MNAAVAPSQPNNRSVAATGCSPLTASEWFRVQQGIPDMAHWGPELLVRFEARRLKNCQVAWLNDGWFLKQGVNTHDGEVRVRVQQWLIREFGFAVVESTNTDDLRRDVCDFFADRYGGTGPHGGSGRVGIKGKFQVKGLGPTPLIGLHADWLHSNGVLWLEEAIREVVYSELARAELPYGSVAAIAIITSSDTLFSSENQMRRALLVRPNSVRPAHMERASLFVPRDANQNLEQRRDAARTREFVQGYQALLKSECSFCVNPEQLFERLGQQVGFGQVMRIFHGGYFSSNVALDGSLVDFGNTTTLPDWTPIRAIEHTKGFGRECEILEILAGEVVFYWNKHAATNERKLDKSTLSAALKSGIQAGVEYR